MKLQRAIQLLLILLTAAGILCLSFLKVNDNAVDLLPGEAVRGDLALLQQLGLVNRVIITLSLTKEPTEAAVTQLKEATRRVGLSCHIATFMGTTIDKDDAFPIRFLAQLNIVSAGAPKG